MATKKKKVVKQTESQIQEKCGRCGGDKFSVANDATARRYCSSKGCNNVWGPKTADQLEVQAAQEDILKFRARAQAADNQRHALMSGINKLQTKLRKMSEDNIQILISDVMYDLDDVINSSSHALEEQQILS